MELWKGLNMILQRGVYINEQQRGRSASTGYKVFLN